ncbi:MAG: SDR family NAD(P)-dependent oxidoreductase [Gammaproteobacteria bacterium]
MITNQVLEFFAGKRVVVTGATGSVGKALVAALLQTGIKRLIGFDHNETGVFFLNQTHRDDDRFEGMIGDVRDLGRLKEVFTNVDVVFHGAALKHVGICEESPFDAVQTNIHGVQNLIKAAASCGISHVLFMSSDKAVNPTNVMGTTKLMGERLMTAADTLHEGENGPLFFSTRFGNVLGSRGSVVEVFQKQIARGQPITLTDERMTRFVMSPAQAVSLVLESVLLARGGEVFVTKMPVVGIPVLAQAMVNELAPRHERKPEDIEVTTVGARAGEKLFEELLNEEEVRRTVELENHFVVLPALQPARRERLDYPGLVSSEIDNAYRSDQEQALTLDQTVDFLRVHELLAPREY